MANLRATIRCFIFLALFCLLSPNVKAAFLQFDVFPGYNNTVREAHWFPVTFEVKNEGPTFAGFIQLSSAQIHRNQTRRVPIELPSGTLKRVTIPVFSSSRYANWTAQLLSEKGKVLAEQEIYAQNQSTVGSPIKQVSYDTHLLGSLARTAGGTPAFPTTQRPNQAEIQPTVARLQPSVFPDNPIALDGLHSLYLNSERALDLKSPQVNALIAWLQGGGHLIVGVEQIADVNGNLWLKSLLPCELVSSTKVKTAGEFQRWIQGMNAVAPSDQTKTNQVKPSSKNKKPSSPAAVVVAPTNNLVTDAVFEQAEIEVATVTLSDGKTTALAGEIPLACQAQRGRGKITVLLFSPERPPFVAWQNRPWFWANVVGISPTVFAVSDFHNYGGWSADGVLGAMIESKQIRKLPLSALLLLLVVYLIVIGPFDQIFLKRINKQMLTWITFPLYVVFFSVLIYFIGFKLRAGDSEWNELHLVDVLANGPKTILRGRTYASVYSPSNQRYRLEGEQFIASLRGEYTANYGNGEETSEASVIQHGNNFSAEISVPVWTSQLYVNDWFQPVNDAPLSLNVSSGEEMVTVENHLDRKLTEVRICVRGKVYEMGELAARQSKEFKFDSSRGLTLPQFVQQHGSKFFQAAQVRRQTFGSSRQLVWDLPNATMAACFISQLNESGNNYQRFIPPGTLDLSELAESDQVVLLAWDGDHSFTPKLNQFEPRRHSQNTLLRVVAPLHSKM